MKIIITENHYKLILETFGEKAEYVKDDLADFYKTLEDVASNDGLSQQSYKSMEYQKEVESMQIGLLLLGYELPIHGVDGLFGPETANAVNKFTSEHVKKDEKNEKTT